MLKFGIYKKEQLNRGCLETFLGKRKSVAIDLYGLSGAAEEDQDYLEERILECFAVGNGVLKRTYITRFENFDYSCLSLIYEHLGAWEELRVHDIGVSDGRSSATFYNRLLRAYSGTLNFIASDYAPSVWIISTSRGGSSRSRVVLDEKGNILQIVWPPFVFNIVKHESNLIYPLNFLIRRLLMKFYAELLRNKASQEDWGVVRYQKTLIAENCRALRDSAEHHFHFEIYDILSGPGTACHVIRAMNLLNASYFSARNMSLAIANIFEALEENGFFIVGSNLESGTEVNGAVYRKRQGRLERIFQSGEGFNGEKFIEESIGVMCFQ